MPIESATATNWSRYAKHAAADLAEIRRRQSELTGQLETLRREEALLKGILDLAEHPAAALDSSPAPTQAQGEPGTEHGPRSTALGALSPAADSATAGDRETAGDVRKGSGDIRPPRARSSAKRKGPRQALLGELLYELLCTHREPCPASDLRQELLRTHPDRNPTPQVVRNTLEALVAKSLVERHKQDRSVLYSPAEKSDPVGQGEPDGS
ncbi:hypothetical protein ABZ770_42350 [Streptomyces sp. NPDC006654]|uniref:hypothetical protein n=1 Tax=Streptomyces sp. NPDC006654 TaxID=3156897 RepID=UPI0034085CB7